VRRFSPADTRDRVLVDADAEARALGRHDMPVLDPDGVAGDIALKILVGDVGVPFEARQREREMRDRGRADRGVGRLAREIDRHAELAHQPCRRHHLKRAAELDQLEAAAGGGAEGMVASDVVGPVQALVGADRDRCRRRAGAHRLDVGPAHRLLDEIEPGLAGTGGEDETVGGAEAFVGVGRDRDPGADRRARGPGAAEVGFGIVGRDLDLERDEPFLTPPPRRLDLVRRPRNAPDHGRAGPLAAAQQLMERQPQMLSGEIEQRRVERRFRRMVGVHGPGQDIADRARVRDLAALEPRGHEPHRGHHAGRCLAGHHRRRGGFSPAGAALPVGDAHDQIVRCGDGAGRHPDRGCHRHRDPQGIDALDPEHGVRPFGLVPLMREAPSGAAD
jgi:hypothetical protein